MKTTFFAVILLSLASVASAQPLRIVALGDSLTAGYGLQQGEDYPSQLQAALRKEGLDVVIDNAGVSGDTTAGGLARVDWAIQGEPKPSLVIVALGANDMLRGLRAEDMKKNLRAILQKLKDKNIKAVVYGVDSGFNLPLLFRSQYSSAFEDVADEFDVPLYESFLDGVSMKAEYNQADGMHPNTKGVAIMVDKTKEFIIDALED